MIFLSVRSLLFLLFATHASLAALAFLSPDFGCLLQLLDKLLLLYLTVQ
jgi:hypothetical protein